MADESNKNLNSKMLVTASPHIHCGLTVSQIMWDVNIALIPMLGVALYNYRLYALSVIVATVLGAVIAEIFAQKIKGVKSTLSDGSAIVTGLLLALCLPPGLPAWIAFVGGFVAIAIGKQIYGGLGQNIFNPAHVGRAILLISWPVFMTSWLKPMADAVSTATPLTLMGQNAANLAGTATKSLAAFNTAGAGDTIVSNTLQSLGLSFSDLFLGIGVPGSIGETSKLAVLIGALYLLFRGHIKLYGPLAMILTVFIGAYAVGGLNYAVLHILTGGLFIGAFFMLTDMVTSPVSNKGNIVFGICCGIITLLIRLKGGYPEGVCYSILIMNAFVPLIDKIFKPKKFGHGGAQK